MGSRWGGVMYFGVAECQLRVESVECQPLCKEQKGWGDLPDQFIQEFVE